LIYSLVKHKYTADRGKLTPGKVIVIESGILKPGEERKVTVSIPSLVSLYSYVNCYT